MPESVRWRKKNIRRRAHIAKDEYGEEEEEGPRIKQAKEENEEEYVLLSTLSGSMTLGEDTWLIDSGASNHMIG